MPQTKRFLTLLICLSLTLAACSSVAQGSGNLPPDKEGMAALDKPFQLHYDEARLLPDENIWIRFTAVQSDNRCPKDVQCVVAGEAHVVLAIAMNDQDAVLIGLSTQLEQSTGVVGDYRVLLQAVEPLPQSSDQPIPAEDYVITLVISRK
jgi:hypothetical protein